jgi:hypothetical protein
MSIVGRRVGLLIGAALFLAGSAPGATIIIASNLALEPLGAQSAEGNTWLAGAFGTDAGVYALSSVTLLMEEIQPGVPAVSLYSDNGNAPGTEIAALTPPSIIPTGPALYTYTSSGANLAPNSIYWIVLRPPTGEYAWSWTYDPVPDGVGAGYRTDWSVSADAGENWTTLDLYPYQFEVQVTTEPTAVVPEPGGVLLAITGIVAGFALRSRAGRTRG